MNDVEVRPSRIHGMGVFAKRSFMKGEVVMVWDITHEVSEDEFRAMAEEVRHEVARLNGKLIHMQSPAKYLNHSCNPNTFSKDGKDIALRDIAAGEEITGNYENDLAPGESMQCLCGNGNCRGTVKS